MQHDSQASDIIKPEKIESIFTSSRSSLVHTGAFFFNKWPFNKSLSVSHLPPSQGDEIEKRGRCKNEKGVMIMKIGSVLESQ